VLQTLVSYTKEQMSDAGKTLSNALKMAKLWALTALGGISSKEIVVGLGEKLVSVTGIDARC
jgi:hypothetical protein